MISKNNKFVEIYQQNQRLETFIEQNFTTLSQISVRLLASIFDKFDKNHQSHGIRHEIESFLHHDFNHIPQIKFPDSQKAIDLVLKTIKNGNKIGIITDYDVDGATSGAILYKFLTELYYFYNQNNRNHQSTQNSQIIINDQNHSSENIIVKIPHRVNDGYGPSIKIFEEFANEKVDLVFTLDCGTSAFEAIEYAKSQNINVIVIDHHTPKGNLPEAFAIINPYLIEVPTDIFEKTKNLAAVGVTFMFIRSIIENSEITLETDFQQNHAPKIDLKKYLDLVAIGTICDMMNINGINRIFIKEGLKLIQSKNNLGLSQLTSSIKDKILSTHIGYIIGPRINAGGRIGNDQYLGFKLLTTSHHIDAMKISNELNVINSIRQDINFDAELEAEIYENPNENFILAVGKWHVGVIGIVASRLKEKFNKPAFVISDSIDISSIDISNNSHNELKGSARSVEGLHLGQLIEHGIQKGILSNGGGHAMAGGFSIKRENLNQMREFLKDFLSTYSWAQSKIFVNLNLSLQSLNSDLLKAIESLEPYGNSNPNPLFLISDLKIKNIMILKEKHMRISVYDNFGNQMDFVYFGVNNTEIGKFLYSCMKNSTRIGFIISISEWNGRVSVNVKDVVDIL
jgi:single-stranded-DNA-specific exonuclease